MEPLMWFLPAANPVINNNKSYVYPATGYVNSRNPWRDIY